MKTGKLERDVTEDLIASGVFSSPPILGYLLAIVAVGALSVYGYKPIPSFEKLLEPLPYVSMGSFGMGSFCLYVRRAIRKAYKIRRTGREITESPSLGNIHLLFFLKLIHGK